MRATLKALRQTLNRSEARADRSLDALDAQGLLPHRHALAFARMLPGRLTRSIIGGTKSNNALARAFMRWRNVGLDGNNPMPSACL